MTVFFDLDKTLLDVNSGSEWLRHEFAAGRVSIWQTVQALVWLLFYHFFLFNCLKNFSFDRNEHSPKFFRIINEVPTILLIIIIFLVVFKPI